MANFGFTTEGTEVVSLYGEAAKGKTIVITGASADGLGAETATAIAHAEPAQIILTGRSAAKVQPVVDEIKKISPRTKAAFVAIDLSDFDSIRKAALEINSQVEQIDILINNAGIMAIQEYTVNKNGVEIQFATNHLGHFLLTKLLIQKVLAAGSSARIINLTSRGHRASPFRFDDYNFSNGEVYDPWTSYGQSKTANILFSKELARRGILSFSVHPGSIWDTGLATHIDLSHFESISAITLRNTGRHFDNDGAGNIESLSNAKTKAQGVSTTLVAALDPSLTEKSGAYLVDCNVALERDYCRDTRNAKDLWELSEKLVGEKFEL